MTSTLQALSLVEKVEPVQVHFTLTREGPMEYISECKMDGKVYMDSYIALNGSCFMVTWTIFNNPCFGGRSNTKPGDYGTPNDHNH